MRSTFSRYALIVGVASALLAGCGGSQPPIGVPGALPQSPAIATHAPRGGSWMLPEAKSDALLYTISGCGESVCVYSYPSGKPVGGLSYQNLGASKLCSDRKGNIYVLASSATKAPMVLEYAHGGAVPISTLQISALEVTSCASDPATGNLAVGFGAWVYPSVPGGVAIFTNARGKPKLYNIPSPIFVNCGYDSGGNLFADGEQGRDSKTTLAELPAGARSFTPLKTDIKGMLGQVQWDGKHVTIEVLPSHSLDRVAITDGEAKLIGTTVLGNAKNIALSWIDGKHVVAGYSTHAHGFQFIGLWPYPTDGNVERIVSHGDEFTDFTDVTLSVAPSR